MARLRIAEIAREKGISQQKLSRMSDVSISTIQTIFHNPELTGITVTTLEKIAKALGVGIAELFEPDEPVE